MLRKAAALKRICGRCAPQNATSSNSYTTSEKVQKKLDKLYMNRGFFIQSQKVTNNQIEILLTSEQVEGSIPYDCKIATLI